MNQRRVELHLFYWTVRLGALLLLPIYISDVPIYQGDMARVLLHGQMPYRDFPFEYPPLTFLLLFIPSFVGHLFQTAASADYRLVLGALLLPFDFGIFYAFLRKPPIPRAAFLYVCLTSLLPFLLFDRMDLAVAFALAFPFLGFEGPLRGSSWRYVLGWGMGGALKLVPALLWPFHLAERKPPFRQAALSTLALGLPLLLSFGLVAWLANGEISFVAYHGRRGVQVETLLGNLMLVLQNFGYLPNLGIETAFRAQQVTGVPGLVETAKLLFWGTLSTSYATLLYQLWRGRTDSLRATWLFVLTFVVFGYVLSPQYLFWLIPLALLVAGQMPRRFRGAFLFLVFLIVTATGLHFFHYWDYANRHRANLLFLLGRNGMLLLLWGLSWWWLRDGVSEKRESADPYRRPPTPDFAELPEPRPAAER